MTPEEFLKVDSDRDWDSAKDGAWNHIYDSTWYFVRTSVQECLNPPMRIPVLDSVWDSVGGSVMNYVWYSVENSVWNSVRDSLRFT